jgi:hypothetical protein
MSLGLAQTYLNDSMYAEMVLTSIPHSVARLANSSGVCILCAPEMISSPTMSIQLNVSKANFLTYRVSKSSLNFKRNKYTQKTLTSLIKLILCCEILENRRNKEKRVQQLDILC